MQSVAEANKSLFENTVASEELLSLLFVAQTQDTVTMNAATASRALVILRALAMLDESHPSEVADMFNPAQAEIDRIEAKVDLLLMLVGEMLRRNARLPEPTKVKWSRLGVCFSTPQIYRPDACGILHIQLDSRVPQPLEIPVRMIAAQEDEQHYRVWCVFENLDGAVSAALERHVFRRHRRQIAQLRQNQS